MTLIFSLLFILFAGAMLRWYTFWKPHADKFQVSGYMPPDTSVFGKFWFNVASRFLVFMTVGRVKVVRLAPLPTGDESVIFASNHQYPPDFAMLRIGSKRHLRMLTSSDELKGFFGVIAAFLGVISVAFREKSDGAAAEEACVRAVAKVRGSLGIFPQGALIPRNILKKEEFRPGIVRISRKAFALQCEEVLSKQRAADAKPVTIVPMAIYYRHDPVHADWTHFFLQKTRSMWLGMRNPKVDDPLFKLDVTTLGDAERAEVERLKEAKTKAYRRSHVTKYGGVVVVGEPINSLTLPEDQFEAVEVIRLKIAELLRIAEQH